MLIAILVILTLIFIADRLLDGSHYREWSALSYMTFWPALIIGVIYVITYSSSASSNAQLQTFAAEAQDAYKQTAQLTQRMVVGDASTAKTNLAVDAAYWAQAKVASDRLMELRDQVVWYNTTLRTKRLYANHWFLGMWIADPPKELKYMKFTF